MSVQLRDPRGFLRGTRCRSEPLRPTRQGVPEISSSLECGGPMEAQRWTLVTVWLLVLISAPATFVTRLTALRSAGLYRAAWWRFVLPLNPQCQASVEIGKCNGPWLRQNHRLHSVNPVKLWNITQWTWGYSDSFPWTPHPGEEGNVPLKYSNTNVVKDCVLYDSVGFLNSSVLLQSVGSVGKGLKGLSLFFK